MTEPTILGIDPALASLGYGLIEGAIALDYGVITTSKNDCVGDRLISIYSDITLLIQKFNPDVIGVEMPFFSAAISNAVVVQHAMGVIRLALAEAGYKDPTFLHQSQVKAAVARGGAKKAEMKAAVQKLYSLEKVKGVPDDALDGLAIAYAVQQGVRANVA